MPEVYSNLLNILTCSGETAGKKHAKGMRWLLRPFHLEALCVCTLNEGDDYAVFKVTVYAAFWRGE